MRMLVIDDNNKYVLDEFGQILLDERPVFSFEYAGLIYGPHDKTRLVEVGGEIVHAAIEEEQRTEIEDFITATRNDYGIRVHAVDGFGNYVGYVKNDDPQIAQVVSSSPPSNDQHVWTKEGWKIAHVVNNAGEYLGIQKLAPGLTLVDTPPKVNDNGYIEKWNHVEKKYVPKEPSIDAVKAAAFNVIGMIGRYRSEELRKTPEGRSTLNKMRVAYATILRQDGFEELAHATEFLDTWDNEIRNAKTVAEARSALIGVKIFASQVMDKDTK